VGEPRNIFFLTCDTFGVLPPIAWLTPAMASYHFLAGFTAKVAGTEAGVVTPAPTFSPCFGAPFMPLEPVVYARLLEERLVRGQTQCWLVNTGWSGGPYGVGKRMRISLMRDVLTAVLDGSLDKVEFTPHPVFRVLVPTTCKGVPERLLDPRATWKDPGEYDARAAEVAQHFAAAFARFAGRVPADVAAAAPVA